MFLNFVSSPNFFENKTSWRPLALTLPSSNMTVVARTAATQSKSAVVDILSSWLPSLFFAAPALRGPRPAVRRRPTMTSSWRAPRWSTPRAPPVPSFCHLIHPSWSGRDSCLLHPPLWNLLYGSLFANGPAPPRTCRGSNPRPTPVLPGLFVARVPPPRSPRCRQRRFCGDRHLRGRLRADRWQPWCRGRRIHEGLIEEVKRKSTGDQSAIVRIGFKSSN